MHTEPAMTLEDFGWTAGWLLLLIVCGAGLMLVAAVFLVPAILGIPNSAPRDGVQTAIEFTIVIGSLLVGEALAMAILSTLSRSFVTPETYERWVKQFSHGADSWPYLLRRLGTFMLKRMEPKEYSGHAL